MEMEQAKSDEEESVTLAEGGKDGGGESSYVMQLEKLLACLQKGVANYGDLSEHLHADIVPAAEEMQKQLKPQLEESLQDLFSQLLMEYHTPEKLQQLEELEATHRGKEPAWKYTGIAEEDYNTQADVAANLLYPQYEELHTEVVGVTNELLKQQEKLQARLKELEEDIDSLTSSLSQTSDNN